MRPLHIVCRIDGPASLGHHGLALDSLLGSVLAQRAGLIPPGPGEEPADLDIPIEMSSCGRLYLASFSIFEIERYEMRWTNQRFPLTEAQTMGAPKLRRVNMRAGPSKTKRAPRELAHLRDGRLDWFAIGDCDRVAALLAEVGHIGGRRGIGGGVVREWSVEIIVAPWSPGFPVVLDGRPLRPLPADWPGIDAQKSVRSRGVLTPPYWWERSRREVDCWVSV